MSIFKVIEIVATSEDSWEEAARNGVKNAAKTIKNIKSVHLKEQKAIVTGENITEFRVILKISFELT